MNISVDLLKAILSMDSYNRGYDAGIVFGINPGSNNYSVDAQGTQIGKITINRNSSDLLQDTDAPIGFYALSYDYNGETIIAYRGTNDVDGIPNPVTDLDVYHGWSLGGGATDSQQGLKAVDFYNQVVAAGASNVTLTGHSLGGGLAGYVAELYGETAVGYNSMAFEAAASATYDAAQYFYYTHEVYNQFQGFWYEVSGSIDATEAAKIAKQVEIDSDPNARNLEISEDYHNRIYAGGTTPVLPDQQGVTGYEVDGEILGPNRWIQQTDVEPLDVNANFGTEINLQSANNRHSQSLLVIRMFAEENEVKNDIGTDWKNAEQYFWPLLFDQDGEENQIDFAESIGFKDATSGALNADGDYAGVMRAAIAYSAIDEGTRPFGDTAIRALYNDANDLGKLLTTTGPGGTFEALAPAISQVFVNFAGQLALNKVLQIAVPGALTVDGVLTYDETAGQKALSVNVSQDEWSALLTQPTNFSEVARTTMLEALFTELNVNYNVLAQIWNQDPAEFIDRVVISAAVGRQDVTLDTSSLADTDVVLVGGRGDDVLKCLLNLLA